MNLLPTRQIVRLVPIGFHQNVLALRPLIDMNHLLLLIPAIVSPMILMFCLLVVLLQTAERVLRMHQADVVLIELRGTIYMTFSALHLEEWKLQK